MLVYRENRPMYTHVQTKLLHLGQSGCKFSQKYLFITLFMFLIHLFRVTKNINYFLNNHHYIIYQIIQLYTIIQLIRI